MEKTKKPQIITMPLKDLKAAPYNPRKISDKAMKGLQASLKRFGLVQPIVFNKRTQRVVGGHQRVKALEAAGEKEASVLLVDLDENEEKALNITLNSPAISGSYTDSLQDMLDELREVLPHEFVDLRLDDLILDIPAMDVKDEDDVPEKPKSPISKKGDLWAMGDHRLICDDSSNAKTIERLLGKKMADMVFTDPPYGVDYGKKNRFLNSFQKAGRNLKDIANDMLPTDALFEMLTKIFTLAREHSADHCSYYVTSPQGGELCMMMMMMMSASGLPTRHILIWNKDAQNFSMGRLDYEYKHEPILYTWKKTHRFEGNGAFKNSVWDIPKPKKSEEHPTMKPVELVENAILNSSRRGDIVLDMFTGSGTTLVAAEKTSRKAHCIEIDPGYCDVIISRWEKITGQKAKRLDR